MFVVTNPLQKHLGWVKEPEQLTGLIQQRPDPAQNPSIVGRYDSTPPGGQKNNPTAKRLFCAHCQTHKHWKGFILAADSGALFMIGSACGPTHYGAERFRHARQIYKQIEDRERLRGRGRLLVLMTDNLKNEVQSLINSQSLKDIEDTGSLVRRASPDMHQRLNSNLLTGDPLKVYTMVRGTNGKPEPALRSIGFLEGTAVIRCGVRARAGELILALEALQGIRDEDWDEIDPSKLLAPIIAVERAAKELVAARKDALKAHEFFSSTNRRRLAKWVKPLHRFFTLDSDGAEPILVSDARVNGGPVEIALITKPSLPRLRACEKAQDAARAE